MIDTLHPYLIFYSSRGATSCWPRY